jgi:hypothetical protein
MSLPFGPFHGNGHDPRECIDLWSMHGTGNVFALRGLGVSGLEKYFYKQYDCWTAILHIRKHRMSLKSFLCVFAAGTP